MGIIRRELSILYDLMTCKGIYKNQYNKYAKQAVKNNKVLLVEPRFPELSDSLRVVKKRLVEIGGFEIVEAHLGMGLRSMHDQHKAIMNFIREMANSKYVFTTDANKSVCGFTKRSETTVVQLWHACGAFKKFGFSSADKLFGGDMRRQKIISQHANYDIVSVSSPEVVWAYEEAMGLSGKGIVRPLGVSRTDVFYDKEFVSEALHRVRKTITSRIESESIPKVTNLAEKKIILYAPTFRGHVDRAETPNALDIEKMSGALSDGYILLIKHHPFVKHHPEIPASCRGFAFDISGDCEIEDLLCAANICITDYSSLIFEYSIFERPMIFFAFDIDDYDDWRGFYYPYEDMTPGPVVKTTYEIVTYIKGLESGFDKNEVVSFKKKFMSACDGRATDRILKEIGIE